MLAQRERIWIAGLAAVAVVLAAALAFVLISGGDDGAAASTPAVSIESLRATGNDAVVDFLVHGHDDPSAISIDWGDGSNPLALRGAGSLSASYTYPPGTTDVIVVVTVTTPDGTVLRDSRPLVLGARPTGEDDPPNAEDPDGTTTTTTPERPTIEVELVPADATFTQSGNGEGSARLDGRTVSVFANTSGLDGAAVRTATLTWTIPASRLEGLTGNYEVQAQLEPTWSVNLRAGANSGRAARWFIDFEASTAGIDLGGANDARSVDSGEERLARGRDPYSFATVVPADVLGDVTVTLNLTCQAIPGSTIFQIGASSTCDASDVGSFNIDAARILFTPAEPD